MSTIFYLTKRNIMVYLRDRATVFFSFLAPLIVFFLYLFFLRNLQFESVVSQFEAIGEWFTYDTQKAYLFVDGWAISGMLGAGSLTVCLGAMITMVQDKAKKISDDFAVSPVKGYQLAASYFIAFAVVSFVMMSLVFSIGLIYLAASGGWTPDAAGIFSVFGILLFSAIVNAAIMMFLVSFIRSEGAFSGLNIVIGSVFGFVIGAYMPLSSFPSGLQTFGALFPATNVTALLRQILMGPIAADLSGGIGELENGLMEGMGGYLRFGDHLIPYYGMFLVILIAFLMFGVLNVLRFSKRGKRNTLNFVSKLKAKEKQ